MCSELSRAFRPQFRFRFLTCADQQSAAGQSVFQCRVGQARSERRLTIMKRREWMVGQRGEAPLVPPNILPSFKKVLTLLNQTSRHVDDFGSTGAPQCAPSPEIDIVRHETNGAVTQRHVNPTCVAAASGKPSRI